MTNDDSSLEITLADDALSDDCTCPTRRSDGGDTNEGDPEFPIHGGAV
jgi:hypothetical protein